MAAVATAAKQAGHTPGPWMVEPINGGETYQITTLESSHFAVVAETPVDGTGRDEANARLIAAAPQMLSALQEVHGWTSSLNFEGLPQSTRQAVRNALAKALPGWA